MSAGDRARMLAARAYWQGLAPWLRTLPPERAAALTGAAQRLARPDPTVRAAMAAALPGVGAARLDAWALEEARLRLRTRLERPRFPTLTAAMTRARCEVQGGEALDAALARGRGAVVIAAHFGVHAMPPISLRLLGWPVSVQRVMVGDDAMSPARAWSQARRRALEDALPVRYLDLDPAEAALEAALGRGEVALVGGDGWAVGEALGQPDRVAPLLGRAIRWPTQGFALAARTGAGAIGLLPASRGRHLLRLFALDGADPQAQYAAYYDRWLREHPGQWQFWREWAAGLLLADPSTTVSAQLATIFGRAAPGGVQRRPAAP